MSTHIAHRESEDEMNHFADDRHNLYVGWVLGIALKNGLRLEPELDADGNYTDRLTLDLAHSSHRITIVVPPPPDDWSLVEG